METHGELRVRAATLVTPHNRTDRSPRGRAPVLRAGRPWPWPCDVCPLALQLADRPAASASATLRLSPCAGRAR
eukprot:6870521-Prymnesium_polylepis.1